MSDYEFLIKGPYWGKDFFNFILTSQLPRHRWYYFKEGFSARLIEEAIRCNKQATRKLRILDPFCGCGTTALTAALLGDQCTGIEVNPFLAFVSKVKVTPGKWNRRCYRNNLRRVIKNASDGLSSPLVGFSTFTKKPGLSKWLFNTPVLGQFASLVESTERFGNSYSDALKLSAIAAAMDCCNAKPDGKGIRYKRDWKKLRYSKRDVMQGFRNHASMVINDMEKNPIETGNAPTIILGDSRQIISQTETDYYDLIITSPPYLNSLDYTDVYRPELFLGEFITSNEALKELRLRTVRSHVQANWPQTTSFESELLTPIVEKLEMSDDLWNHKIPLMVKAYFDDLWKVFQGLWPKLRVGGEAWIIVSTSAYGGIQIPTDFILADVGRSLGFQLKGIHCLRRLRASGQQWKQFDSKELPLRESLIILRKP